MARVHYWQFLIDEEGRPIEGADVYVLLANSDEGAFIYKDEISGEAVSSLPQLKTNTEGFFEFWIGDLSEINGYNSTQKFKLYWERIGIASGMIDYLDVFPPTIPVDETDNSPDKNKSVSNKLAKGWEEHRIDLNHIIHGIREYNFKEDDLKLNKLGSNRFFNLWNEHRLMNFNLMSVSPSSYESRAEWEDENSDIYGAHGLQSINVSGGNSSDTIFNKLMNNSLGNKWDSHTNFSFKLHTESTSGFINTPHDLYPVDFGTLSYPTTSSSIEEINEYDKYNKLVSNRLIKNILDNISIRPMSFNKTIYKEQWAPSLYNEGFYTSIIHGLNTETINISCFKIGKRKLEDGRMIDAKILFTPADVYIVSQNEITIYVNEITDVYVIITGQNDKLIEME